MPFYLCVDGGGTKTTAAVAYVVGTQSAQSRVAFGQGQSGPSNLTTGVLACVSATVEAICRAVDDLRQVSSIPIPPVDNKDVFPYFAQVWAGYAGCARPEDHAKLYPALSSMFPDTALRLSSDAELLTSPFLSDPATHCITVISGTGSLGFLWEKQGGAPTMIRRAGGWGSLLGDEGSGWSLGREAVKSVLTFAANGQQLLPWHLRILSEFNVTNPHSLLPAAIRLPDGYVTMHDAEVARKKRIAACSVFVVEAIDSEDVEALKLVDKVASELGALIQSLREVKEEREVLLVVTGGLGSSPIFWSKVESYLAQNRVTFRTTMFVQNPAKQGVLAMIERNAFM